MFSSLGTAMSIMRPVNVRPIVKQKLVSLDGKVLEDLGAVIPDCFFWFYSPVFTALKTVPSAYGPVYYRGHIVVYLCVLGP